MYKFAKIFLLIFVFSVFVLPFPTYAGKAEGGQIDIFDIQPRSVKGGQTVEFKFKVTLFYPEIRDYCGPVESNLRWVINRKFPGDSKSAFKSGQVRFDQFFDGVSKDLSFLTPVFSVPANSKWIFSAKIYCGVAIPSTISESSEVEITVQGGGTGGGTELNWACIASDGKYACSPGNKSNLTDVPACSGKQPIQIDKKKCGQVADKPGGGGACNNNNICEPSIGETSASCKDCPVTSGKTETFIFKLENPLEADNFIELIDVLATWLFNLAIPVVVVMIVYAGVMFLTSRGEPAKVTKARQILLYAVVGFAIILIGKGFITLIESILNL